MLAEPRDQWGRGRPGGGAAAGLEGEAGSGKTGILGSPGGAAGHPGQGLPCPRPSEEVPGRWGGGRPPGIGARGRDRAPLLSQVLERHGRCWARAGERPEAGRPAGGTSRTGSAEGLAPPQRPRQASAPRQPTAPFGPIVSWASPERTHVHGCPAKPIKLQPSGLRPHAVSGHSRGNRGLGPRSRGGP